MQHHPRVQHYRDDHAGVLAALPPSHDGEGSSRSLPKGELLCVGRNLGLCVLALCFAFVALR
jgi:hypothetical protein